MPLIRANRITIAIFSMVGHCWNQFDAVSSSMQSDSMHLHVQLEHNLKSCEIIRRPQLPRGCSTDNVVRKLKPEPLLARQHDIGSAVTRIRFNWRGTVSIGRAISCIDSYPHGRPAWQDFSYDWLDSVPKVKCKVSTASELKSRYSTVFSNVTDVVIDSSFVCLVFYLEIWVSLIMSYCR